MTGMAALAISAAFTSCSKDTDVYNKEVIQENTKQTIVNNYNEAFVKTFGQPAANHKWGFVNYAKAGTRDVDVNGNMWETRPELGATEEQDVLDYMDMTLAQMDAQTPAHRYSKNFPVNMPNFFVTQVHTGDDNYGSAQDPNNKNVLGSSHMNELVIAITKSAARTNNTIASNTLPEADSWHHVNNFNAGSSKDWGGNTKFVNMGTCDFAYHNSKDSRFHNRWIVVSGADIDAALGVNKYTGYYYVCFDFQSQVPDGQTDKTYFSFSGLNDSGTMQSGYNGEIEGFYQTAQDIIDAGITEIKGYDGKTRKIEDIEDFTVTRWEHGDKIIPGDNNYSDWIIRLVAATPDNDDPDDPEDPEYTLRVICEDLNAQAQAGDTEDSDWDFNDLVFDVAFLGSDQVQIKVVAVGGTLPIRINGEDALEAHRLFGQGTDKMINTGAGAKFPNQAYEATSTPDAAIFTRTIAGVNAAYGANIKVEVQKGNDWIELEAKPGQPASKMGVMPDFTICTERQDIRTRYSNFVAWVNTQTPQYWWRTTNE